MTIMHSSLAYHEPSITVISILSGFLLLLNIVNYGLDRIAYCGLIGQVALGIAWGTPGAKWLSHQVEDAVLQLGYLGLILIVYEGGLSTSFRSLKANIGLSSGVAVTGIMLPIGLSFAVKSMLNASLMQAFAAGAALCSTSLGTTFTILGTSGLSSTRLGVVLTSAAMMDDVVGLIMVQVISNIGGDDFTAVTVVRPILVSLGLATIVPLFCKLVVSPLTIKLNAFREAHPAGRISRLCLKLQTAFVLHTCWLLGLVVGGTFAGTSSLLAAYIAGATISWWDSEVPHVSVQSSSRADATRNASESTAESDPPAGNQTTNSVEQAPEFALGLSGRETYEEIYEAAVQRILKPFFFVGSLSLIRCILSDKIKASIGFSVPITRMFSGPVAWRGIIYTVLMTIAKLACGLWLAPFVNPLHALEQVSGRVSMLGRKHSKVLKSGTQCTEIASTEPSQHRPAEPITSDDREDIPLETLPNLDPRPVSSEMRSFTPRPEMPVSLYPASIVGLGMVARGEIGFLIAALAESTGIFGRPANGGPSELFLVVTWAISLCTIIGPICVGLLVNRVKRLEAGSKVRNGEGKRDVLGAWGVS